MSNNPVRTGHRIVRRGPCRCRIPVGVMKRAGRLVVDIAERYIEDKPLRDARVVVTDVLIFPVRHRSHKFAVLLARPHEPMGGCEAQETVMSGGQFGTMKLHGAFS